MAGLGQFSRGSSCNLAFTFSKMVVTHVTGVWAGCLFSIVKGVSS